MLDEVKVRITTLGKDGVEITGHGLDRIHVPVARDVIADDPTGVGDGFRAGFFAALSWGLGLGTRGAGRLAGGGAGPGDGRTAGVRGQAGRIR